MVHVLIMTKIIKIKILCDIIFSPNVVYTCYTNYISALFQTGIIPELATVHKYQLHAFETKFAGQDHLKAIVVKHLHFFKFDWIVSLSSDFSASSLLTNNQNVSYFQNFTKNARLNRELENDQHQGKTVQKSKK